MVSRVPFLLKIEALGEEVKALRFSQPALTFRFNLASCGDLARVVGHYVPLELHPQDQVKVLPGNCISPLTRIKSCSGQLEEGQMHGS